MKLRMLEEIALLLLDDDTGRPIGPPAPADDYALASAILMQLSLDGRIVADPRQLVVTSSEPTGDPVLDEALTTVAGHPGTRDSRRCILEFCGGTEQFRALVLDCLTAKGSLRKEEGTSSRSSPIAAIPSPSRGSRRRARSATACAPCCSTTLARSRTTPS